MEKLIHHTDRYSNYKDDSEVKQSGGQRSTGHCATIESVIPADRYVVTTQGKGAAPVLTVSISLASIMTAATQLLAINLMNWTWSCF